MQIALIVIPVAVLAISILIGWRKNIYQAAITFGVTVVSVVLSALISELLYPTVLEWAEPIVRGLIHDDVAADYLYETQVGHELSQVMGSFIEPIVFFEIFLLVLVVLSLLALIPLHFLSDKYKAKKAAKLNVAPATEEGAQSEQVVTEEAQEPSSEKEKAAKTKKLWFKVASVTLSVISGFIIFVFAMVPVTAYSDAITNVGESIEHIVEGNQGVLQMVKEVEELNSHPTMVFCRSINSSVASSFNKVAIDTKDGPIEDHATDIFNAIIRLVDRVSEMDSENLQSKDLIQIAEIVETDPYLQHFMNHVIHDASANWKDGENFLGVEPMIFVNDELSHELYDLLATSDVVKVMKMSGRLLGIVEVTAPEDAPSGDPENPGSTPETEPKKELSVVVEELFNEVDNDTVAIVDKLLSGEVMGEITGTDSSIADIDSAVFTSVINAVNEVKQDDTKQDEQKQDEIRKGAESLAKIVEISQKDSTTNEEAEEILETVISSEILVQTAVKVAESTENDDPLNIKDKMTDDALEKVEEKLLEYGYELGSPEHEAILKLLKK